jgi:hypothetical protein
VCFATASASGTKVPNTWQKRIGAFGGRLLIWILRNKLLKSGCGDPLIFVIKAILFRALKEDQSWIFKQKMLSGVVYFQMAKT